MKKEERPSDDLPAIVTDRKLKDYWLVDRSGEVTHMSNSNLVAKMVGSSGRKIYGNMDGHIYDGFRVFHSPDFDPVAAVKTWDRDAVIQKHAPNVRKQIVAIDIETEEAYLLNCDAGILSKDLGVYKTKLELIICAGGVAGKCILMYRDVYDKMVEQNRIRDYVMVTRYMLKLDSAFAAMYKRKRRMVEEAADSMV